MSRDQLTIDEETNEVLKNFESTGIFLTRDQRIEAEVLASKWEDAELDFNIYLKEILNHD